MGLYNTNENVASASGAVEIDLSSTDATLASGCRGLYVGTSGDVKIDLPGATGVTFVGVAGLLPVQATKVYKTGTDASDIVALY